MPSAIDPYDVKVISLFNTIYSTVRSIAKYWTCDSLTQNLEGTPWTEIKFERMLRGSLVNLASGGGPIWQYFQLGLDRMLPGNGLRTVLLKSTIDTAWGTTHTYAFLYLYAWSKEGHEAGMTAIRDNSWEMNVAIWSITFPSNVFIFYSSGWEREAVAFTVSVIGVMITSYFGNRKLPIAPAPSIGHEGGNDSPGNDGAVKGTTSKGTGEKEHGEGPGARPEEGGLVDDREAEERKGTAMNPPPIVPPPAEEKGNEEWERKRPRFSPCCFVFTLLRPEILKGTGGEKAHTQ